MNKIFSIPENRLETEQPESVLFLDYLMGPAPQGPREATRPARLEDLHQALHNRPDRFGPRLDPAGFLVRSSQGINAKKAKFLSSSHMHGRNSLAKWHLHSDGY